MHNDALDLAINRGDYPHEVSEKPGMRVCRSGLEDRSLSSHDSRRSCTRRHQRGEADEATVEASRKEDQDFSHSW